MSETIKSIGKILTGKEGRDAIHIAVAPVVAAERLMPGQHVELTDKGAVLGYKTESKPIGIVDPFLESWVNTGESFYLFLYPGTITSLRHEWTHPTFEPKAEPQDPKAASVAWLTEIAQQCGVTYERMMDAIESDSYIHMGENEHYTEVLDGKLDDLKKHAEIVLGRTLSDTPYPFSCSC